MSRIRANTIVNGAGTGAPNFPRGAIISGISTINADLNASNVSFSGITTTNQLSLGTGTSISSPANNTLALGTNSSERILINSVGDIGIGTDDPTAKLEVATSVDGEAILATFKNTSGGGTNETVDIKLGLENIVASNVILRAGKEANHSSSAATDNFFSIHTTSDNTSAERLRISSEGYVTKPNQPAWSVFSGNNCQSHTESDVWLNNIWIGGQNEGTIHVNTGNHYTPGNGRFTAPVSGKYWVYFAATTVGTSNHFIQILKNGLSVGDALQLSYSVAYMSASYIAVFDLAEDDYVTVNRRASGYRFYNMQWGGYLIG